MQARIKVGSWANLFQKFVHGVQGLIPAVSSHTSNLLIGSGKMYIVGILNQTLKQRWTSIHLINNNLIPVNNRQWQNSIILNLRKYDYKLIYTRKLH